MTSIRQGYVVYAFTRMQADTSLSTVNPGIRICMQGSTFIFSVGLQALLISADHGLHQACWCL